MDKRKTQVTTHAPKVLQALDEFETERKTHGPPLTLDEQQSVRVLRRDAIHHILQQRDNLVFGDMARLKEKELRYLHQVRTIRQQSPSAIFGTGYSGYGNGWTGDKMRLLYAQNRKRYGRKSREIFMPIQLQGSTTYMEEELVPVRIDFENDKYKLQDTFTWNLKDTAIPLEVFIDSLLEDFCMPLALSPQIVSSVKDQLDGYCYHIEPKEAQGDDLNSDMRITIKLDITIGQHNLTDQFEWDMNCRENNPEEFASVMCAELALSGEFATAIAHSIREQCQVHTKMLYVTGYKFDGRQPTDKEFLQELTPLVSISSFLRNPMLVRGFTPVLHQLPSNEFEKHDQDRDGRRRRRQGRTNRRGLTSSFPTPSQLGAQVTLSDLKETMRTTETPVFSSLLPGGLDKNLAILRAAVTGCDETVDTGPETLAYYMKIRNRMDIPSAALFRADMPHDHQQRYIVKLKMPSAEQQVEIRAARAERERLEREERERTQSQPLAQGLSQPLSQGQPQPLGSVVPSVVPSAAASIALSAAPPTAASSAASATASNAASAAASNGASPHISPFVAHAQPHQQVPQPAQPAPAPAQPSAQPQAGEPNALGEPEDMHDMDDFNFESQFFTDF